VISLLNGVNAASRALTAFLYAGSDRLTRLIEAFAEARRALRAESLMLSFEGL
jgi:hypothetical protein